MVLADPTIRLILDILFESGVPMTTLGVLFILLRILIGSLCLGGFLLLVGVIIYSILRIRTVKRLYQKLPSEVIEAVLHQVEQASVHGPAVTLLMRDPTPSSPDDWDCLSHVGGRPYAEAGETWPDGSPGTFLIQVLLNDPVLGAVWQGRLVTVFFVHDFEQRVRIHAQPAPTRFETMHSPAPLLPLVGLKHLRMPAEMEQLDEIPDDVPRSIVPASPDRLCSAIPAITELLKPYTRQPQTLLTQILCPQAGHTLEPSDIAFIHGGPWLIQNPHNATCPLCAQPMRFLFQFGEIIPHLQLGDAGVCYVYGCDHHQDQVKGFIDSH